MGQSRGKSLRLAISIAAIFVISAATITAVLSQTVGKSDAATNAYGYNWEQLKIGASGWVTGLTISPDGKQRLARTDVGGAYRWDTPSDKWVPLITATAMPPEARRSFRNSGVYEVVSAPSNNSRIYMAWRNTMYVSSNNGQSFATSTNGLPSSISFDANDDTRFFFDKIAVSPNNPDIALYGTPNEGMFRTSDGGRSWSKVGSVPNGQKPGVTGIAFDPSSPNVVYATPYGSGSYRSTDGGVSFTRIGGPSGAKDAVVSSNGTYFVVGDGGGRSAQRYSGGNWTIITTPPGSPEAIAVHPRDPNRIVVMDDANWTAVAFQSTNAGSSYTRADWTAMNGPGDVPHIGDAYEPRGFVGAAELQFDPLSSDRLWLSMGFGVLTAQLPLGTTSFVWQTTSRGIEELVGKDVIAPPGGPVVTASMDRSIWITSDPNVYPTRQRPNTRFNSAWDLDYSPSNSKYMAAVIGDMRFCCTEDGQTIQSGYSNDGGNTWTRFASIPNNPRTSYDWGFGNIAVSSPGNIVWVPSQGKQPFYTKDNGNSWQPINLPGGHAGLHFGWYLDRKVVTADRVTPGTFYIYNANGGVSRSIDGGTSWQTVKSGALSSLSQFNAQIEAVPGNAGHLFYTDGPLDEGVGAGYGNFQRSTDGGASWSTVPNVTEVHKFGFGVAKSGSSYPTIFIAGHVNGVYGIYYSSDNAQSWVKTADFANNLLDQVTSITGDPSVFGKVYVAFGGAGFAYGQPSSGGGGSSTTARPTVAPSSTMTTSTRTIPSSSSIPETVTSSTQTTTTNPPDTRHPTTTSIPKPPDLPTSSTIYTGGSSSVLKMKTFTVRNSPDAVCVGSMYVALFNTRGSQWFVVDTNWTGQADNNWSLTLTAPAEVGDHYLLRTYCNDRPSSDTFITVSTASPPVTVEPTSLPRSTTKVTAGQLANVPANQEFNVTNSAGSTCVGGIYVALFDTSQADWQRISSDFDNSQTGAWTLTLKSPQKTGSSFLFRTYCNNTPGIDTQITFVN